MAELNAFTNPFDAEEGNDGEGLDATAQGNKVHIRIQQRNGRKVITHVTGLADDLDLKRICRALKRNLNCNGAVRTDSEVGEVVQLSGDQRVNVRDFLVDQEICHADQIVIHGG